MCYPNAIELNALNLWYLATSFRLCSVVRMRWLWFRPQRPLGLSGCRPVSSLSPGYCCCLAQWPLCVRVCVCVLYVLLVAQRVFVVCLACVIGGLLCTLNDNYSPVLIRWRTVRLHTTLAKCSSLTKTREKRERKKTERSWKSQFRAYQYTIFILRFCRYRFLQWFIQYGTYSYVLSLLHNFFTKIRYIRMQFRTFSSAYFIYNLIALFRYNKLLNGMVNHWCFNYHSLIIWMLKIYVLTRCE